MATDVELAGSDVRETVGRYVQVLRRLEGMLWLALFLVHLIGGVLWFVVQPGGFAMTHPRFWVNRVIPILVILWAAGSMGALHRTQGRIPSIWLFPWSALWAGLAIASRIVFPETLGRTWVVPLSVALVLAIRSFSNRPSRSGTFRVQAAAVAGVAFSCGIFCVLSQRPPHPSTAPVGGTLEIVEVGNSPNATRREGSLLVPAGLMVQSGDASVTMRFENLTIFASPLLRFLSRSPDGCWTAFVPASLREGTEPRFLSVKPLDRPQSSLWSYSFPGQGPAQFRLGRRPGSQSLEIEALSQNDRPIHSHLNSYCDLELRGHRRLSLEFSPCPGTRVEVRKFDYPVGRPARFAFVDRERRFRVVEATSGEKGPFRVLAEGRLERPEPLRITLHDEDRPVSSVTLHDWSAQAGTELSPTAGWGVPVNAIEFSLNEDAPSSPASIFITLAATSIGRGWDCVTHPSGVYRNRMTIEPSSP